MILHCWYCSLGGERKGEHSEVAKVKGNLAVPVTPAMFSPVNGTGVPPFAQTEWRYMKHSACGRYPWPQDYVTPGDGPTKILTDRGLISVKSTPKPALTQKKKLDCPHCDKQFDPHGLYNHIRFKHKEVVNG